MTVSLERYLDDYACSSTLRDVGRTVLDMSAAAVTVHRAIAAGRVPDGRSPDTCSANASGDIQKALDVFADDAFLAAVRTSPVRVYGSEERPEPVDLGGEGMLALAIDPLDGSSNIETNVAVGTIFSLLPLTPGNANPRTVFEQPGDRQLAAGFFMYGAQLLLVMTIGSGTVSFIWKGEGAGFTLAGEGHVIPAQTREYSINASNRRHWTPGIRRYIEDAEAGEEGPLGRNFGMRYTGSLVADTFRILQRGGIFLYPGDRRTGYGRGRLRQIYEANPIAFCIEQAGGAATDGRNRMLELQPADLHARTPLVFGSRAEVDVLAAYTAAEQPDSARADAA